MLNLKESKGLTLIELVVSMAIFGIIAVGFISMFTSSLLWIYGAGDKGEAYNKAQQDIEARIAIGEGTNTNDISLNFNGKNYTIRGALIESTQSVNNRQSYLKTFVPLLPTIVLHPVVRYEGDQSTSITINGIDTNFNPSTSVEIFDSTGNNKIGSSIGVTYINLTKVVVNIPSNFLNNDYIVRVTTPISGKPNEVSRAKYRVEQPKFIAVGDNGVYISANGTTWINRYSLPNIAPYSDMKSIANNSVDYVIAGNNGNTLMSNDNAPWTHKLISGNENILTVSWSPTFNKFYSGGINGGIYSLDSNSYWTSMMSGTTSPVKGFVSTGFTNLPNMINAVGENNILYSGNGSSWLPANITYVSTNPLDPYVLNSAASGIDLIVAAGNSGYIGRSSDGINWEMHKLLTGNITDIAYNGIIGQFIAVGDNGLIIRSSDGIVWTTVSSGIIDNFTGIFTQGLELVIVGENGNILYLNNINSLSSVGTSFNISTVGAAVKLRSVSGK